MTIIKLLGAHGGELDRVEVPDGTEDGPIQSAVVELAMRCILRAGDTITITEED
jgi:hypothetical protein